MSAVAKGLVREGGGRPGGAADGRGGPSSSGRLPSGRAGSGGGEEEPSVCPEGGGGGGWLDCYRYKNAPEHRRRRGRGKGGLRGEAALLVCGEKGKANRGKGEGIRPLPVGGRLFTPVARRGRERPQRGGLPSLLPAAAGAIGPARSLRAVGVERDEGQEQKSRRVEGEKRLAYPDAATVETGRAGSKKQRSWNRGMVWPARPSRQLERRAAGAKAEALERAGRLAKLAGQRGPREVEGVKE